MESMSKIPHFTYLRQATTYAHAQLVDGLINDGLTDVYNNIPMGTCVEKTNAEMGITREMQDEWAIKSYERARAKQNDGTFDWEITPIINQTRKGEVTIAKDEECQKFLPDKFGKLKPAFIKNGTITAANASKLNDGASALLLSSEEWASEKGIKPIARVLGYGDSIVSPIDFAIAPAKACENALKMAGMTERDIDYHEINEAFASVPIANIKLLDIDPAKVNVHGGACALGHPIGMSGNRIILSLINVLRANNGSIGMASICNGGGGASAFIVERLQ
jgi:acetyl-CoA C-acetyltransferase